MKTSSLFFAVLALCDVAFSQGFENLDFESAQVSGYSQGVYIPIANALPAWNGYAINSINGTQAITQVFYNATSPIIASSPQISLQSTNGSSGIPGLATYQGAYSVLLEGLLFGGNGFAAIGQNGEIPTNAMSLTFLGTFGGQITFGGQSISYTAIQNLTNYSIYQADISAFAGQTGELLFQTTQSAKLCSLDNIRFSPQSVPEPACLDYLLPAFCIWYCFRKIKMTDTKHELTAVAAAVAIHAASRRWLSFGRRQNFSH